jgi:hypothetical protein
MSSESKPVREITLWRLLPIALVTLAACTDGLEPVPFQGISGTVAFVGEAPDSTDWVRLAAYPELPDSLLDVLDFAALSDELVLFEDSTKYALSLDPGLFQWLPLVWKAAGVPLSLESVRIVGWYTEGGGPFDAPESFPVVSTEETVDISLIGDFDNMPTLAEALELLR